MKDSFLKKAKMESFILPFTALFLLIVGVPFLIKYHSVYTTQYVFISIIGFFVFFIRIISLLNLHIKSIDILLTIPIIIISSTSLIIFGTLSSLIVLIYPKSLYKVSYWLALISLFTLGVTLNFKGQPPPKNTHFIVVANHTSFIDELLIVIAMMGFPWTIIFAEEIKRIPFFGKMLRDYSISVDRNDQGSKVVAGKRIIGAIHLKKNIALFPEEKRMRPNDFEKGIVLYPFKIGAFYLACKYNLPIYPVLFVFPYYYKRRSGQWWVSPRTITIVNMEPVLTEGKSSQQVTEEVHEIMEETLKSYLII